MPSAAICYLPADAGSATELRSYLETNCPISFEDGVAQIGSDLLDAVETGLAFDFVLVLLSSDALTPPWQRDRWQSILLDQPKQLRTRLIFVQLSDCKIPALLRKETFFDLSRDFAAGRRSLKRRLLAELLPAPHQPLLPEDAAPPDADAELFEHLADWPDFSRTSDRASALHFARLRQADFESVAWLSCARRGRVGIFGDIASGLGLRLEEDWEHNAAALTQHCAEHRVLLIFENLDPAAHELVNLGGKASIIVVENAALPARRPLSELTRLFSSWRRNASQCMTALGDVESLLDSPEILQDPNWQAACTLCKAAVALLKDYGRYAEALDLLTRLSSATQVRGDLAASGDVEWETHWILEQWDQPVQLPGRLAVDLAEPVQLTLFEAPPKARATGA